MKNIVGYLTATSGGTVNYSKSKRYIDISTDVTSWENIYSDNTEENWTELLNAKGDRAFLAIKLKRY